MKHYWYIVKYALREPEVQKVVEPTLVVKAFRKFLESVPHIGPFWTRAEARTFLKKWR